MGYQSFQLLVMGHHKELLSQQHMHMREPDLEKLHKETFRKWFQENGEKICLEDDKRIVEDLQWLSKGPSSIAKRIKKLNYNGFKFRTKEAELHSPTQNSGVVVCSEGDVTYYDVLREILLLDYYEGRTVVLFKCDWVDMTKGKGIKEDGLGFMLVNFKHLWKTSEPYVLASQAFQVFYTPEPIEANWNVVTRTKPRHVFDMGDDDPFQVTKLYFDCEPHTSDVLETVIVDLGVCKCIA